MRISLNNEGSYRTIGHQFNTIGGTIMEWHTLPDPKEAPSQLDKLLDLYNKVDENISGLENAMLDSSFYCIFKWENRDINLNLVNQDAIKDSIRDLRQIKKEILELSVRS